MVYCFRSDSAVRLILILCPCVKNGSGPGSTGNTGTVHDSCLVNLTNSCIVIFMGHLGPVISWS